MSSLEVLYEEEAVDPDYCRDSVTYGDIEIYYVQFGYHRDSLQKLFPIFIVDAQDEDLYEFRRKIRSFINDIDKNDDIYIRAPGSFEGTRVEDAKIRLGYIPLPYESMSDLPNRNKAGWLADELYEELDDKNIYDKGKEKGGVEYAQFTFKYNGRPEILLPFLTESNIDDEDIRSTQKELEIPIYVLLNERSMSKIESDPADYVEMMILYNGLPIGEMSDR